MCSKKRANKTEEPRGGGAETKILRRVYGREDIEMGQ